MKRGKRKERVTQKMINRRAAAGSPNSSGSGADTRGDAAAAAIGKRGAARRNRRGAATQPATCAILSSATNQDCARCSTLKIAQRYERMRAARQRQRAR